MMVQLAIFQLYDETEVIHIQYKLYHSGILSFHLFLTLSCDTG